jgi:putative ABC transport system ATP-binding protein
MIKCNNIVKSYNQGDRTYPVLKGVSFDVGQGEFVCMMGKSGSGKTTVLNILGLLDHPCSGEYLLDNQSMQALSANKRAELRNSCLGFIFQHFFLLPRLTIEQNILLPLHYCVGDTSQLAARLDIIMRRLDIIEHKTKFPAQLSGGQQQRVAICRSLICMPKVLLADEPTGALDQENGESLMHLLQELNKQEGLSIFMITHDKEVASYADKVLYLVDGVLKNRG